MNITPSITEALLLGASFAICYIGLLVLAIARGFTRSILSAREYPLWRTAGAALLTFAVYVVAFSCISAPIIALFHLASNA